jgi:hypothetical protein
MTNVSEVCTGPNNIAPMMAAVSPSETSVNIYLTTWQYIPEDSKLHTCCRENLKSQKAKCYLHHNQYIRKLSTHLSAWFSNRTIAYFDFINNYSSLKDLLLW